MRGRALPTSPEKLKPTPSDPAESHAERASLEEAAPHPTCSRSPAPREGVQAATPELHTRERAALPLAEILCPSFSLKVHQMLDLATVSV